MASSGAGASGGFSFPNANVQVVSLDPTSSYKRLDQFAIWNNDYAFTYPSLATNDRSEVGIALGWGGKTFFANSAVGILGDFVVWYPELSDVSTTRWGDYVTARQASPETSLFAGFGYSILKDATVTAGLRFDPFYLLFGRNSIINPGGGGDGPHRLATARPPRIRCARGAAVRHRAGRLSRQRAGAPGAGARDGRSSGIVGSAELDVRDGPAVLAAVGAARPDVVVHTAYRLDDPSVNVEGTRAVAAAAVAAGARLVHLSSDVVFPGTRRRGR